MEENLKNEPLVSIVVPVRNEEKYIDKLIDSIKNQNYSLEKLEIIFVDGNSEDKTIKVIEENKKNNLNIRIIKNPLKIIPISMNLGIKEAKGKYIVRLDAHATYNSEYISSAIKTLEEKKEIVSVGGYAYFFPIDRSIKSFVCTKVFASYFATGNKLRVNSKTNLVSKYYDTAVYGAFRKKELDMVNGYNEKLAVAQDIELYDRLKKLNNGKIYVNANMKINYFFKAKTGLDLFKRQYRISSWILKRKQGLRIRHLCPIFAGILGLIILFINPKIILFFFAIYTILCSYFYLIETRNIKERVYVFYAIYAFFMNHFGYFCGTTKSIINYLINFNK